MAVCLSLCVSLTAGCTRRPMAAGTDSPRTACDAELEKKKKMHRYIKQLQERRNHYKETLNTSSSTTNKSPQMGKNGVPAWFFFPWKIWRMKSDSRTSAVSNKLHKTCWMCQEMIQIKTSINCKLRLNKYSSFKEITSSGNYFMAQVLQGKRTTTKICNKYEETQSL